MSMLTFENLTRYFGKKCAVSNLNLTVKQGQVMGFLGPNGAGKSTSMKMAAGYLKPSSGRVLLGDLDIWKTPERAKSRLGYLPESAPLYQDLTCTEFLHYLACLRGFHKQERRREVDTVIDNCFLEPVREQLVQTLSKGYRHRLCLAQSLLGNPEILIFDEPTDGLDPNQKQEIRDLIHRIRHKKAIIVSTHILEEVEAVCTDVFIIKHGQEVFAGTPRKLKRLSQKSDQFIIEGRGPSPEQFIDALKTKEYVTQAEFTKDTDEYFHLKLTTSCDEPHPISFLQQAILTTAQNHQIEILTISSPQGETLESFRQLTLT